MAITPAKPSSPASPRWWDQKKGQPTASAVIAAINNCQEVTRGLQERLQRCAKAFGGRGYTVQGRFPAITGQGSTGPRQGPRDNIIYAGISACASLLLQDGPPGVAVATNHGNYEEQHRAELLEQFFDGIAYRCGLDAVSTRQLFDALIFGTGFKHYWLSPDNEVCIERVFPAEIFVDPWDARDQDPRCMYRVSFIDRDILAARFPSQRKLIEDTKPQMFPWFSVTTSMSTANVIPWVQAWRLPDSDESAGRYTAIIGNGDVLEDKPYEGETFPFSVLRYEDLPTGFYGMGIAELGTGHQLSLNNANTAEYWAWSQMAAPRIWAQAGSLNRDHVSSSLSGIILEGTTPPQVLNWSATHPAFVEWKAALKQDFFQLIGLSNMTVGGVKPPGLDSGEAQREYKATLSGRFSVLSQKWAELRCEDFRQIVSLCRRASAEDKEFSVRVMGKGFSKLIKFSDAELDEDEYRIRAKPVSQLPKTVAGQIQTAEELVQSQFADVDSARKIITSVPDLGAAADLFNAAQDNAKRTAYLMLHEGTYIPPDPLQNLQLCVKVVTAEALHAMDNDAPPERIDLCRQWLVQAKALLQPPAPPAVLGAGSPGAGAPPPGNGPGGGPIAAGAQAPQSSLVPFRPPPQ